MIRRHHFVPGAVVVLLVAGTFLVAALQGCSTTIVEPEAADVPPPATSAAGAVERFAWGLNHKDVDVVRQLLTDDFLFISAGTDSAGNPSRVPNGGRFWFLDVIEDSSSTVSFVVDQNLIPFPDSRPGRDPKWHKQVRTSVEVVIRSSGAIGNYDLTGNALFFLTRGDSAAIPGYLISRGVKPDSTRWWLDRYEDETLAGGGAH